METIKIEIGAHDLILETGHLAKQANGSILSRYGDISVLATACCSLEANDELDFIPLHVEYNEKYYAAGKIPGGFIKRETRPKDKEILVSRLIDRPMRPLFSKDFKREIQVIPTTISADQVHTPDVVAMNAAFAAVHISDIPFDGPVAAVRIGYCDDAIIINPTFEQIAEGSLDIIVAGTQLGVTMVEGGGSEISEELLLEAIDRAREPIAALCAAQEELRAVVGKPKIPLQQSDYRLECHDDIVAHAKPLLEEACFVKGKEQRAKAIREVSSETLERFAEQVPEEKMGYYTELMEELESAIIRESILKRRLRTDGRGPEDIRAIECQTGPLPRPHGSALFTRGETQALVITTLGTIYDEQILDDIEGDRRQRFMLHYNFPPYSVGETGRLATGRREIGHGHLAHRAIEAVLPDKSSFPYTVRIVSDILESNGSSSMATVCGSSLSLMDGGVPVVKPVAGIAMGLVKEDDETVVLSDILGEEDHLGDMDFKVAGTDAGITAFQMDIKLKNVDISIMKTALEQARRGRLHILSIMDQTIEKHREHLSKFAPRVIQFTVDPEQIGLLIGPAGKTIKAVNERYQVSTNIEDSGSVTIYCEDSEKGEQAKRDFLKLLEDPEVGRIYDGVVRRIVDFGAFIEFLPGKEGLCHISKMADYRVNAVSDVLQMNESVKVKIIEIDKMGRVNLSLLYEEKSGGRGYGGREGGRDGGRGYGGRDGGRGHGGREGGRDGGRGHGGREGGRDGGRGYGGREGNRSQSHR